MRAYEEEMEDGFRGAVATVRAVWGFGFLDSEEGHVEGDVTRSELD